MSTKTEKGTPWFTNSKVSVTVGMEILTPNDLIAMLQELGFGYRPPVGSKLHKDPSSETRQ